MAVRTYEWQNPFGVVNIDGLDIISLEEKPIDKSHINAGIYALDPVAFDYLKKMKNVICQCYLRELENLEIEQSPIPCMNHG